ncbi:hypothetical protein Pelo_16280 [Pelomyxa schiedti]|nr:hypothetical protein Pelo_16280 [Pelomyxa schiedti]
MNRGPQEIVRNGNNDHDQRVYADYGTPSLRAIVRLARLGTATQPTTTTTTAAGGTLLVAVSGYEACVGVLPRASEVLFCVDHELADKLGGCVQRVAAAEFDYGSLEMWGRRDEDSFYLRNIESGTTRPLVYGDKLVRQHVTNGKWFVYVTESLSSLIIANVWERDIQGGPVACDVSLPVRQHSGRRLICNRVCLDEVLLCTVGYESSSTVELTLLQVEQTWETKKLTVLSSTRFRAQSPDLWNALVLYKSSGARTFVVIWQETTRGPTLIRIVEEGTESTKDTDAQFLQTGLESPSRIWQISSSLFCVVSQTQIGNPPILEVWDINRITRGSQKLINCSDDTVDVMAECWFLFSTLGSDRSKVEVIDASTGGKILTLSNHNMGFPISVHGLFSFYCDSF